MGTMCVPSKIIWPTFKRLQMEYLVFPRRTLEPRVLPWQQHSRCHSFSFTMYTAGAKFEEHGFNISRVIVAVSVVLL